VTQTDQIPADQVASEGWPEFAAWLRDRRVTLIALAMIAVQVVLNSYVLGRGFFQEDDFVIGGLASHSFTMHLLFQNYGGHLMPGAFALAWVLAHIGSGYDWGLWAGSLVILQALAGLAMLRALRTLVGSRLAILIPLGVFVFTPMTVPALSWWAAGINAVPIELAVPLAVDQHVRYIRTGRIRNVVFAVGWVLFALAFNEKSAAIPLLLFALTSAYLVPGSWPRAMLTTLRRHWLAWALYLAVIITEIVSYAFSLPTSSAQPRVPHASIAAAFGWDLLWRNFVPTAFGGPWHWTPAYPSPPWQLYATAAPPQVLGIVSGALAALVVIASLWYRRHAWRAWVILLGWLALADYAPIALGRVAEFGALLSSQTQYVADAAPVLAICLAIAFLPLRGEEHAYRARLPRRWPRAAATGALAAVVVVGALVSDGTYRGMLHPQNSRSYLATASAALASAPPGAIIYQTQIPNQMAWLLFGPGSQVQNALGPLINQADRRDIQWTTGPYGMTNRLFIFDAQGQLHPAAVAGPTTLPYRKPSGCLLTARGMRLPLTAGVYALPLLMQVAYYASAPVTLAVTFGGHQSLLTLPATPLANAYLPVRGPGDTVTIMAVTPDPHICIGTITVGNVAPAAAGTPLPLFPLSG
jgi:hypothetical protein